MACKGGATLTSQTMIHNTQWKTHANHHLSGTSHTFSSFQSAMPILVLFLHILFPSVPAFLSVGSIDLLKPLNLHRNTALLDVEVWLFKWVFHLCGMCGRTSQEGYFKLTLISGLFRSGVWSQKLMFLMVQLIQFDQIFECCSPQHNPLSWTIPISPSRNAICS